MDFYEKLLSYKALNKLSWNDIGSVIGKEQATMRIAVNRKSLSDLEIREIENNFFIEKKEDLKVPEDTYRLKRKTGEPTKEEFKKLAEKHLFILEGYRLDKDGNEEMQIYGFDALYEQLILSGVVKCVYVVTERDNYGEQLFKGVFANKEKAVKYLAEDGLTESNIDEINEIELD